MTSVSHSTISQFGWINQTRSNSTNQPRNQPTNHQPTNQADNQPTQGVVRSPFACTCAPSERLSPLCPPTLTHPLTHSLTHSLTPSLLHHIHSQSLTVTHSHSLSFLCLSVGLRCHAVTVRAVDRRRQRIPWHCRCTPTFSALTHALTHSLTHHRRSIGIDASIIQPATSEGRSRKCRRTNCKHTCINSVQQHAARKEHGTWNAERGHTTHAR